MKESTKRIALRLYYITLGVSLSGVCIAFLGMLIEHDTLYYTGLVLASPLFVTVLPIGVLLLALTPIAAAFHAITRMRARKLGGGLFASDSELDEIDSDLEDADAKDVSPE